MEKRIQNSRKITYPGIKRNSYLITENGDVYSLLIDKMISPYIDKDGYLKVGLMGATIPRKNVFIHRLVAFQYVPNPNEYPIVDHINGKKNDNHYTNLEWVTIKENTLRAERLGLRKVTGEYNGNNIYPEELIRYICQLLEDGLGCMDIFRLLEGEYKTTEENFPLYALINKLRNREVWSTITSEYRYTKDSTKRKGKKHKPVISSNGKYSEEMIRRICELLQEKYTIQDIIEDFTGERDILKHKKLYDVIQGLRHRKNWEYITKDYTYDIDSTSTRTSAVDYNMYNLACDGYSKKELRRMYGLSSKYDNPKLNYQIEKAVDRYRSIRDLQNNENIELDVS